jgi:pyruvate-formate lyase-activating enzyme
MKGRKLNSMKEINLDSNIRYKVIESERIEDAPFVGALISAIDCNFNCSNCFNQSIKSLPTQEKSAIEIINCVKSNSFNKGIILAGLEWTYLQSYEAIDLAYNAKENGLKVMLYTGRNFDDTKIQALLSTGVFDYIKCGTYREELKTINHIEYGVTLASSNQHIYKQGTDF